jgi:hypothetical protein
MTLLSLLAAASLARAAPADYGCRRPLAACTRERVLKLRDQSRRLAAAARRTPPAGLSDAQKEKLRAFNDWLLSQSAKARALADRGETPAIDADSLKTFNASYLRLQDEMSEESRRYAAVSAILKTKRDAVKHSVGDVR